MAGNRFPRVSRRGHRGDQEDHSRKWLKMAKKDFRGYMVGNGFPRIIRHSPTTFEVCFLEFHNISTLRRDISNHLLLV